MNRLWRCFIVLLALPLGGAASCDSDSPTAAAPEDPGAGAAETITVPTTVTLAVGDRVVVEPDRIEVAFVSVVEDSRCPIDVTCVWAGRAVARVEVTGGGEGAVALDLEVGGPPAEAHGLRLSAPAIEPPQREGQEIRPEDYRLELALDRAGS